MKIINKIRKFGRTFPKLFVWVYASIFIACGVLVILGVLYEFLTKGAVN